MTARVLDVSALEEGTADSRALLWWGNLGMMAIEGTMFALLLASYLYLRTVNFDWPPASVPMPDLLLPTINLALLILSCGVMLMADRAAQRGNTTLVRVGFAICIVMAIAFLVIRAMAMSMIGFKWSSHAYGSIIWTIAGMHTFHMIAAAGEATLLLVYSLVRKLDKKHLLDVRCTAVYWYFVVISWLPFYVIVWLMPHLSRKS
jgi:cytochrome c oxidase subunit 1/cytochrome c oxidase subunit I+III